MRKVILAESAGFCYGVKRAIEIAERAAAEGECYTLGAIIHNKAETDRLESLGAHLAKEIDDIPDGSTVIMRSHGSPRSDYERLEKKGCTIVDATCPNVSRIHRIVRQAEDAILVDTTELDLEASQNAVAALIEKRMQA